MLERQTPLGAAPPIPVGRVFWPSVHMKWQLEECMTAPASRWACCRQVFLFHSQLYFSALLYFSAVLYFLTVLYLFSFVASVDYPSPAIPAPIIPGTYGRLASSWAGRRWVGWGVMVLVFRWKHGREEAGQEGSDRPDHQGLSLQCQWPAWMSSFFPIISSWPLPASPYCPIIHRGLKWRTRG